MGQGFPALMVCSCLAWAENLIPVEPEPASGILTASFSLSPDTAADDASIFTTKARRDVARMEIGKKAESNRGGQGAEVE
jgi:hypothetical protein